MNTAKKLTLGLLRGSGAAAEFSPLDIAGLALWLDASDASTLFQASNGTTPAVADDDPVGYWGDKSGAGRNAVQTGATRRPLLKLSVKNGLNTIRNDGIDDYLKATFGATLAQPNALWLVDIAASSSDKYHCDGIATSNRHAMFQNAGNVDLYAGSTLSTLGVTDTNWNIYTVIFNGASSSLRANGSLIKSGNMGTNTLTGLNVGARWNDLSCIPADFAEIIIATGAVSASTITDVETYLNAKWAVY